MIAVPYATLERARVEVKEGDPDVTTDDAKIMQALRDATARIDSKVSAPYRPFLPIIETRYHNANPTSEGGDVDGRTLKLAGPLLAATTVTNGDGAVIASDQYTLLPKGGPYDRIVLASGFGWVGTSDGVAADAIAVAGTWGYHPAYADAWWQADALQDAVDAATTTITVADAQGMDPFGRAPRFSVGQLVRWEQEWGLVAAITLGTDPAPDTLTVVRGVRGSTKASHADGVAVEVFEVYEPIAHACARWASVLYRRQGIFAESAFDTNTGIATRYAKDIPADVVGDLAPFMQRTRILGV